MVAGRSVYIGSFTDPHGEGSGITLALQDPSSGRLTSRGVVGVTPSPSFLALHPSEHFLYAASAAEEADVTAFAVEGSGGLRELGSRATGGRVACHLAVHPSGRWLVTAHYGSGSVSVHSIEAGGAVGARTDLVVHQGTGPDPVRQARPHVHQVRFDSAASHVIAVDLGSDAIVTYAFDPAAGRLSRVGTRMTRPGAGPRHLAFGKSGVVHVVSELDSSVTTFAFRDGRLQPLAAVQSTARPICGENYPSEILTSEDGRFVYVANRGMDVVTTFKVEGSRLSPKHDAAVRGSWPRHIAILGTRLYVANERSHSVEQFDLDLVSGIPSPTGHFLSVPSPACILPDPSP